MNYKDLILYKTLYEEKNITHTAKRLFLSQPAISDRIKRFEAEFGCQLVVREPRGIQFTPKGEYLYDYCLKALSQYNLVKEHLLSDATEVRGHLPIAASNIFARYFMPNLLKEFHELHPHIEVSMESGFSHGLFRKFLEGQFPVAITRGHHGWNEHRVKLWEEPLCLFNKTQTTLDDVPHLPYISYKTDPALLHRIEEWWYSHYATPPKTTSEVDSIDTCIKLVNEGVGFTFLSHTLRYDYPELYHLHLEKSDGQPLLLETWMYYRNNYESMDQIKAFVDFINSKVPIQFIR